MASSNSSSASTSIASAFPANLSQTLGMASRDEDKKHKSPTSSPKEVEEMRIEGAFKCKFCPRAFKTALARGGHQKAHRQLHAPKKNKKANKGRRPVWSPASGCSYATALRSACLQAHPFGDWRSHYDPSVCPLPPSFPWQTGTSTGSPAAALAVGGTGDGGLLGRQQDVREVSQEEAAGGIDLTLKL